MRRYGTMEADMGGRPLVQWRAVFGGVVLGLGIMVMVTSLWLALGFGSEVETVRANMDWYIAGTAIGALLIAGFLAGWLSGIRGPAAGMVNGSTVWALTLIAVLAVGIPSALRVFEQAEATALSGEASWTTFWGILIGFGAALIGGVLGGMIPRGTVTMVGERHEVTEHAGEPGRDGADRRERERREAERLEAEAERLRTEAEQHRRAS